MIHRIILRQSKTILLPSHLVSIMLKLYLIAPKRIYKENVQMKKFNYYKSEIEKLDMNSQFPFVIQIWDGMGGHTKCLSLNKETLKLLNKIINQRNRNEKV